MFDGLTILDLWVSVDALLTNARLLFPLPVDEQTGAVLNRPRRANDRGLTFTLTPTLTGDRLRCELKGSIHRFSRGGLHNADDFTAADLLAALDELVTIYAINPFLSRLNNIEFGVNVRLPFPVSVVLDNLISYKYRPFVKEPGDGFSYYQCQTQRYIVKLYNKGQQYGLSDNVLRVEVKVLKMEYLTRRGVRLDWLADLLTVDNYGALGALLVETFTEILFDEPTIETATLTTRERDIYQNGRNPRFWSIPANLTGKEYERCRKAFQRTETKFRALLNQHRQGTNWQSLTAALIGETWGQLATVDADLLSRIDERRAAWHTDSINSDNRELTGKTIAVNRELIGNSNPDNTHETVTELPANCPKLTGLSEPNSERGTPAKCPKLTGSVNGLKNDELSQINPLSVVLNWDNASTENTDLNPNRETVDSEVDKRQKTRAKPQPSKRPTATQLRANPELLTEVEKGRKQYAKGSKENQFDRAAHNLRNDESNERNNLAKRVRRIVEVSEGEPLPVFAPVEVIKLTPDQRAALDYWQGTRHEIKI